MTHSTFRIATYDLHAIHTIINTAKVVHVSFTAPPDDGADDCFPAILPMIGVMGSFAYPSSDLNEPLDCYLHGYVSSRLMKFGREGGQNGLPVSIAATKIDGIVLSLTPNSHSYNYRSAILFGYATLVTNEEEKLWAMKLITDSVLPGRWENTRVPPDRAEMASTSILRVKVVSGSGKIRDGGPADNDKDTKREDVVGMVWTGFVPIWETFGEPVFGGKGRLVEPPAHVTDFVRKGNEREAREATTSVVVKLPNEEYSEEE